MTPTQRTAALRLAEYLNAQSSIVSRDGAALLRELAVSGATDPVGLPAGEQTGPVSVAPTSEPVQKCPRIELVVAIHSLASHFENSLYAFRDDAEALLKAKRDIAWAMKTAAKHNQNGPGCYAHPPQQRKPLPLDDIARILVSVGADPDSAGDWHLDFARAVEAAHGIKEEA